MSWPAAPGSSRPAARTGSPRRTARRRAPRRRPGRAASPRRSPRPAAPSRWSDRRAVGQHDHDGRRVGAAAARRAGPVCSAGRSMSARSQPSDSAPAAGRGTAARSRPPPAAVSAPPPPASAASASAVDQPVARGEVAPWRPAQRGGQLVERHVDPGRADLRAARALVARCPGELADHGDVSAGRGASGSRPPSFFSSTAHSARGPPGQRVVRVATSDPPAAPRPRPGALVDQLAAPGATARRARRRSSSPARPRRRSPRSLAAFGRRHLQVQTGRQAATRS